METLFKDIRYGFRSLWKRKGFTLTATITLALGIGANTAIFTLLNAVLYKQLPVTKPNELVLFDDSRSEGTSAGDPRVGQWERFSYASYEYFRDHNQSFQTLSAFRHGEDPLSVRRSDAPQGQAATRARGHLVSGNYFEALGVGALLGRVLTSDDDKPEARPAAVVSYDYWKQQLNSDQTIVGKDLLINGTAFTVVGVMQPQFFGTRVRRAPDFWMPLAFQPQIELRDSYLKDQNVYWLNIVGRLRPGVSLAQAQATVNMELGQFLSAQAGGQLSEERKKEIGNTFVKLAPGARGISGLRSIYSEPLKMLMAIVGLVLLIACANIGNLLLARAASRHAEISLRLALGASRARIIRQLLTESLMLAALGGACGILVAEWGVSVLVGLVAKTSPLDVRPDVLVLGFTAGASLLAGLLFGLAPALRASRVNLTAALKERTIRHGGRLRFNLASSLIVAQIVLSMVLLTGAGLFARSLMKLQEEEVGFDRDHVLLVSIDSRLAGYKPAALTSLYQQLLDRISALPNVRSVSMESYAPMSGSSTNSNLTVQGYSPRPDEDMSADNSLVGPNHSETLGVPVLRGRDIGPRDTAASTKVAVVNQAFAEHFFHGQSPIGRTFSFGDEPHPDKLIEIVGVVGNVKYSSAREKSELAIFRPMLQVQDSSAYANTLEIRTDGDPAKLGPAVREAITQVDDKLPIFGVTTLREQLNGTLQQEQLIAELMSFFGLLALVLASVGLYGVMAHGVARRTNEIGIRMALGAERRNIIWLVLRETLVLVAIGVAIGIPIALGAARLVSSQLFGLTGADPLTLLVSAIVLTVVAALAGFLPARRASLVNPLIALRYE